MIAYARSKLSNMWQYSEMARVRVSHGSDVCGLVR